jgi:hypothetical protein
MENIGQNFQQQNKKRPRDGENDDGNRMKQENPSKRFRCPLSAIINGKQRWRPILRVEISFKFFSFFFLLKYSNFRSDRKG